MTEQTAGYCLRHGLEVYLQDAAQLYCGTASCSSAAEWMAHYLSAAVCGQHLPWRHYAFVAGTHFNRKCFLASAQRSLSPVSAGAAGRLSFGDTHSLLQLLCPDFPAAVVKNAWSSAVAVQECESHTNSPSVGTLCRLLQYMIQWVTSVFATVTGVDYQQDKQQQQPDRTPQQAAGTQQEHPPAPLVQFAVFWQCLQVTFLHEHCLLLIRREAFDRDKKCECSRQEGGPPSQ